MFEITKELKSQQPTETEKDRSRLQSSIPYVKKTFDNAFDAYIYGYPLVMMGVTLQQLNNTPQDPGNGGAGGAPMNQFALQTQWPGPEAKNVVLLSTSTLYMIASLNLRDEPIVMNLPAFTDMNGENTRFFIMQVLDGWTNVIENTPGRRVDSQPGKYVFVGTNYEERNNEFDGMTVIRMDTDTAWIIGRVFSDGRAEDLAWINEKIYPNLYLQPLSKHNEPYQPEIIQVDPVVDIVTAPFYQIQKMDASAFYGRMAAMLNYCPPLDTKKDRKMVKKLEQIGFNFGTTENPEVSFDFTELDLQSQATVQSALEAAAQFQEKRKGSNSSKTNQWTFPRYKFLGDFGTKFKNRANIARWALGANRVEDCVYGYSTMDSNGNALSGNFKYELKFDGPIPLEKGSFWSVTIYNSDGTLVDNSNATKAGVDYDAIGQPLIQDHDVTVDPDGSITLYLQADAPPADSDKFNNWLPIPNNEEFKGTKEFIVFLRIYSPILWGQERNIEKGPLYLVKGPNGENWIPNGITKAE
ncbi:MAG: DUF1254 domain-containing protein [Crocinitomicaceae bacterium]|nr:DUF1254 domain-containing protein [Crocinitomicaceae bacterium]